MFGASRVPWLFEVGFFKTLVIAVERLGGLKFQTYTLRTLPFYGSGARGRVNHHGQRSYADGRAGGKQRHEGFRVVGGEVETCRVRRRV